MDNYCVCCGEIIPEGRMVCPLCESAILKIPAGNYTKKELRNKFFEFKEKGKNT